MRGYDAEVSPTWTGHGRDRAVPLPHRGAAALEPREMIGAYYRSVGFSWNGGTVLDPEGG